MPRSSWSVAFGMLILLSHSACSGDSDSLAQPMTPSAQPAPDSGLPTSVLGVAGGNNGAAGNPAITSPSVPDTTAANSSAGSAAPIAGAAGSTSMPSGAAGQAAPAAAGSGALPPPPVPAPLKWTTCGTFECATLSVPLDYAAPSGEQIQLAVKRRAARGQKIGSLLVNPGGPGGSALDFLTSFAAGPGQTLLQRFDLVAFDPRGVGQSTPIDCHSTIERMLATDPTPDDEAEWTESDQAAAAFADECAKKYPKLLPHLGTPDVARDMDQVRAAVGDEKLTYLGFSYGTELGAWYAELFPTHVRALVLDGALDLNLSALDVVLEQSQGFEKALATYFDWCAASSSNCRWAQGNTPSATFQKLSAAVDASPISVRGSDRRVGSGEFMLGVIAPLYGGEQGYAALSSALVAAGSGDGSALLSLVDQYTERHRDGTYGNIQEANNAVNCLDMPSPPYTELRAQQMRFAAAAPIFGVGGLTGLLVCAHWSVQAVKPPPPRAAGAPPILIVGTTGDPATPYAWAQALADELESGALLTYEGEGHTAYGRSVSCIDNAVNTYLTSGKLPADGTRCGASGSASPSMIAPSMLRLGAVR